MFLLLFSRYNSGMATIGYSGTPLAKKLGIQAPLRMVLIHPPDGYVAWIGGVPEGVQFVAKAKPPIEAVHMFVTESTELNALLSKFRNELKPDGFIWVSWYKKSAKQQTDITEDVIREIALPLGLVDVKVCAVSEQWSGLKLVIRRSERKK